ncbi:hypothetical protein Sango_1596800 [Sesamum angolense]|uniref:Uncharacterized protein n=1 Tax=Sesamum angolense TaxID=2727404 RepID=A0AAE1WJ86_9LAMI|nr:hypothetical protein Sango_1596800 [Sesamum angolense]
MSLLEVITKAASAIATLPDQESDYPIVLNPEPILLKLKPEADIPPAENSVKKVTGWEITQTDHELIELGQNFFKKLKRKLKTRTRSKKGYACKLVEKLGVLMDRNVSGLVLESCIVLEIWDVLEILIVNGLVGHSLTSNLVSKLIEKRESDLIVLCVKHLLDLQTYDIMCILKYFLMVPGDGYKSLASVREHWQSQASLAIEKASAKGVNGKEKSWAKEAALLVMLAHDGFSVSELCLHYLLTSQNLEVGPCPKASSALGLKVCDWIPTLEVVVKCLSVVMDEHFSSLVLHSEFHELRLLEEVVSSLATEASSVFVGLCSFSMTGVGYG